MKTCPRCGAILIEETYENEDLGSSSAKESRITLSGCSGGSVDYYVAPNTRSKTTIYRCPNP